MKTAAGSYNSFRYSGEYTDDDDNIPMFGGEWEENNSNSYHYQTQYDRNNALSYKMTEEQSRAGRCVTTYGKPQLNQFEKEVETSFENTLAGKLRAEAGITDELIKANATEWRPDDMLMMAGIGDAVTVAKCLAIGMRKVVIGTVAKAEVNLGFKIDIQMCAQKSPDALIKGNMSGKEVVKVLKKEGFEVIGQNGSHVKLKGPSGNIAIVPVHGNKSLPIGTLKNIINQAGLK